MVTGIEITDLAQRLAIVDGGTGDQCRCLGWPTILVHNSHGDLIARWTLHHQSALQGVCDADLRDGPGLTEWLAQHGLTGSKEIQMKLAAQEAESEQRRMRWLHAAPVGLAGVAADVTEPPNRDYDGWLEAEQRLAALFRQRYPDEIDRVRILLAWAGIPSREASGGLKWYDLAVQRLLLAEAPDIVLTALIVQSPSAAQLDGAVQLFSSFAFEPESSGMGGLLPDGGVQAYVHRDRQPPVVVDVQVGGADPPQQAEVVGEGPLLRRVQPGQVGPVGVR
nr:hypothetical protein [Nocardia amamiensis]